MNLAELKQLNIARYWLKPADLTVTQAEGSEMRLKGMIPVQLEKQKATLQ